MDKKNDSAGSRGFCDAGQQKGVANLKYYDWASTNSVTRVIVVFKV